MSFAHWGLVVGGLMVLSAVVGGLVVTRPNSRAAHDDPAAVRARRTAMYGALCFAAAPLLLTAEDLGPPDWQVALVVAEGVAVVVGVALVVTGFLRYRRTQPTGAQR